MASKLEGGGSDGVEGRLWSEGMKVLGARVTHASESGADGAHCVELYNRGRQDVRQFVERTLRGKKG